MIIIDWDRKAWENGRYKNNSIYNGWRGFGLL
jgi:hypothetical protein